MLQIEIQVTNATKKMLPFKLWFDFAYHSPYYEVTYTVQVKQQFENPSHRQRPAWTSASRSFNYFDFCTSISLLTSLLQSLSTLHTGICIFCFDNFISTFNISVAAQLRILSHEVEIIAERCVESTVDERREDPSRSHATELMLKKLRKYIQWHLTLMRYVRDMQRVFGIILFGQLLFSSMIICFGGFQFLVSSHL
jgi:hypothetical protein